MTKYSKMNEGEGLPVTMGTTVKEACCDCGLVHTIQFFQTEDGFDIAHWRDQRATAQLRRHKYGNLQNTGGKYILVEK